MKLHCVVTACVEKNPLRCTVSPRCKHFGFSIQVAFSEVRECDLGLLSLLNHINILIFFHVSF